MSQRDVRGVTIRQGNVHLPNYPVINFDSLAIRQPHKEIALRHNIVQSRYTFVIDVNVHPSLLIQNLRDTRCSKTTVEDAVII